MSKNYEGQLYKVATKDGDRYAPGLTLPECPGLAVTACAFGRFEITHLPTGTRVSSGNYERCDNAILDMCRLTLIAKTYGFSWEEKDLRDRIKEHGKKPVPFNGATITDAAGERPLPVQNWIFNLRSALPWGSIDTQLWEENPPQKQAEELLEELAKENHIPDAGK